MPCFRSGFGQRAKTSNVLIAPTDEPDMSSIGSLLVSYSATDMASYADITAMGNDGGASFHLVPVPSPVTTSSGPNTNETILISPGRLGSGKIPHMMWDGTNQFSATFSTFPENFGNVVPDGSQNYFQFYAKMTIGGDGLFKLAGHSQGINVKFAEYWFHHSGNRTQTNTRYAIGTNPDTATACWELLDSIEVDSDSQQPLGVRPETLWNGQWHRFTFGICIGTSTSKFQRLWIDGNKVIDCSLATINVTPPTGIKPWCTANEFARLTENDAVSKLLFGSVYTGDGSNPWTMNIDNFLWRYV